MKIVVKYRTPSLNVTKHQHWTAQYREQARAFNALLSALLATASIPSTPTTSPGESKTYWTAYVTLRSFLGMSHGVSNSKRSRKKLVTTAKNGS